MPRQGEMMGFGDSGDDSNYVVLPGGCRIIIDDASTSDIRGAGIDANGLVNRIEGITGYAEECDKVIVSAPGLTGYAVEADVDPITRTWSAPPLIIKPAADLCGNTVQLQAQCAENPDCIEIKDIWQLPCSICPSVTGTAAADGDCVGAERVVTFALQFDAPLPAGSTVTINWAYSPGGSTESFATANELATHTHTRSYPAGTYYPSAFVSIDMNDEPCDDLYVEFGAIVVQEGCEDPLPCPQLTLAEVVVSDCAPNSPIASFQATIDPVPPAVPATEYHWQLITPDGQTFTRTTTGLSASTDQLWVNEGTGADAPIDLNSPGAYAISVLADVANTAVGCDVEASRTFTVEACPQCPVIVLDEPNVVGCIPGEAQVSFAASVTPANTVVSAYHWEIGFAGAGGATRTTQFPIVSSEDDWDFGEDDEEPLTDHLTNLNQITVTAIVDALPEDCVQPSNSRQFVIEPCNGNGNDDDDIEQPDGDDITINWCLIAMIAMLGLMAVGALLLGIGVCLLGVPEPSTATKWAGIIITIIGAVLLIVGFIIFLFWLFFCGTLPSHCWLLCILQEVLSILLAISGILAIVVGIIAALMGDFFCWLGFAIDAVYFGALLYIVRWFMRIVGCSVDCEEEIEGILQRVLSWITDRLGMSNT